MYVLVVAACLLAQVREGDPPGQGAATIAGRALEHVRQQYRDDAEKCVFHAGAERRHQLALVEKPIFRWATDDDWSGDVFVWMHEGQPGVIGCILSGPAGESNRNVFHEFHVLSQSPLAPAGLQTGRNWEPEGGLARIALDDAPPPADSAAGRLAQMRQLTRDFTAHMDADGSWELRLLPQPLMRFGDEKTAQQSGLIDGALFTWVWSKGTDPELILLIECRRTDSGPVWHYAPVRFSTRKLWLEHGEREVWRVDSHREPASGTTTLIYTTAYARTFPREAAADE